MRHLVFGLLAVLLLGRTALAEVGEDGLHKKDWFTVTFKDVAEDIRDAEKQGKRLAMIFEQRGCIYCKQLHEGPLSNPEIAQIMDISVRSVESLTARGKRALADIMAGRKAELGYSDDTPE